MDGNGHRWVLIVWRQLLTVVYSPVVDGQAYFLTMAGTGPVTQAPSSTMTSTLCCGQNGATSPEVPVAGGGISELTVLDGTTGAIRWTYTHQGTEVQEVNVAHGLIYALINTGNQTFYANALVAFDVRSQQEHWPISTALNGMALVNDAL